MREVETERRIGREVTIWIAIGSRLDLDHPGAKIGQQRRRIGTGDEGCALDDRDVVEDFDRHEYLSALIFHGSERLATRFAQKSSSINAGANVKSKQSTTVLFKPATARLDSKPCDSSRTRDRSARRD